MYRSKSPPSWRRMSQLVDDFAMQHLSGLVLELRVGFVVSEMSRRYLALSELLLRTSLLRLSTVGTV